MEITCEVERKREANNESDRAIKRLDTLPSFAWSESLIGNRYLAPAFHIPLTMLSCAFKSICSVFSPAFSFWAGP